MRHSVSIFLQKLVVARPWFTFRCESARCRRGPVGRSATQPGPSRSGLCPRNDAAPVPDPDEVGPVRAVAAPRRPPGGCSGHVGAAGAGRMPGGGRRSGRVAPRGGAPVGASGASSGRRSRSPCPTTGVPEARSTWWCIGPPAGRPRRPARASRSRRPPPTLLVLGSVVDAAAAGVGGGGRHPQRRLTTFERLVEMVDRLGRSGRHGIGGAAAAVGGAGAGGGYGERARGRDGAVVAAGGDRRLRAAVRGGRACGSTLPVRRRKLGIEVNGLAFHSGADDLQRNWRKLNRLLALGWRILQFTWADIRYRPDDVLAQLAMAMAA